MMINTYRNNSVIMKLNDHITERKSINQGA